MTSPSRRPPRPRSARSDGRAAEESELTVVAAGSPWWRGRAGPLWLGLTVDAPRRLGEGQPGLDVAHFGHRQVTVGQVSFLFS